MGYASEKPDHALETLRQSKALRGNTRYTGNLIAFRQESALAGKADAPKRAGFQRPDRTKPVSPRPVAQTSNVQTPATYQPPATPSLSVGSIQPKQQAVEQQAANNKSSHSSSTPEIRKSTLALAVIGSLSAGALGGSVLPVLNRVPDLNPSALSGTAATQSIAPTIIAEPAVDTPSVVQPETTITASIQSLAQGETDRTSPPLLQQTQADLTADPKADPVANPVVPVQSTAEALAKEYLVEIDWLIDQNINLQQDVQSLSTETLELNEELLGLELEITSLEAEKEADIRTVYNFVDVPIGSDFTSNLADSSVPSTHFNANTSPSLDNYDDGYQDIDQIDFPESEAEFNALYESLEEDFESLEEDFLDPNNLDANGLYFDEDEPAFDPETGFYVDQQYVADVYQFEPGAQVAYDPDTGFYVNPNFASGFQDDNFGEGQQIQDFPPIGQDF